MIKIESNGDFVKKERIQINGRLVKKWQKFKLMGPFVTSDKILINAFLVKK